MPGMKVRLRSGGLAMAMAVLALGAGCGGGSSGGKARTLEKRGELPISGIGDVWASGTTVYLAGRSSGSVFIVDASDPDNPSLIREIQGLGYPQDVKESGGLLYTTNEDSFLGIDSGIGLWIHDVTDPMDPRLVGQVDSPGLENVHNVYVDGTWAYLASDETGQMHIVDVSDPSAPGDEARVGAPGTDTWDIIHDMMARDGRCYAAFLGAGFAVIDVANPAFPAVLAFHDYPGAFTHNIWPSEDGNHVFTSDENEGGHLRVWDIRDLGDIRQVGSYVANPSNTIHNVVVNGRYAAIAYYKDGLRILDVSDPTRPVEVGAHDTYPGPDGFEFRGAWGVYPFTRRFIYLSDMDSGLHVFRF